MNRIVQEKVIPMINDLILDYKDRNEGKWSKAESFCIDDIDENDQSTLAAYLFEANDRDICAISENKYIDKMESSLFNLLNIGLIEDKIHFADTFKKYFTKYYENKIQELIQECITCIQQEERDEYRASGRSIYRHYDNNEIIRSTWS